jgi:hypothetical protein
MIVSINIKLGYGRALRVSDLRCIAAHDQGLEDQQYLLD